LVRCRIRAPIYLCSSPNFWETDDIIGRKSCLKRYYSSRLKTNLWSVENRTFILIRYCTCIILYIKYDVTHAHLHQTSLWPLGKKSSFFSISWHALWICLHNTRSAIFVKWKKKRRNCNVGTWSMHYYIILKVTGTILLERPKKKSRDS